MMRQSDGRAPFILRGRNPDVLTCIANLSNDEVFTPPEFAGRMLDTLAEAWSANKDGANIWADPNVTFLDPVTKSGVFLREIASRLIKGLQGEIRDLEDRVDHVLTKQLYGIAITHLTSLLARRSLYCSKDASSVHSVARSFREDKAPCGNIWFERIQHTWTRGRCQDCGASQKTFDRGTGAETHAYAFIHTNDIKARIAGLFGGNMQFDVIIGNPPYQLADEGFGTSAAPIYHLFVERALELNPQFAVFVTPSRWMAGGKGLDAYRQKMLSDRRIRKIVDFPKLYEGFPGVKIRGGISYFLWDHAYEGPCEIQTIWEGKPAGPAMSRYLDAYDVLVRRNEAISILEKVRARNEPTLNTRVSSRKPFGFPTNFHGAPTPAGLKDPVKLYGSQRISWVERTAIHQNVEWVVKWKVLMTPIQGTSAAVERIFLSKPIIAGPSEACTETYLVAGLFDCEQDARRYTTYLRTRFVRFLVSLRKSTQHATKSVYAFVPDLPVDQDWIDAKLYKRYGFSQDEISFIESQIAEHTDASSDGLTDATSDELLEPDPDDE